MGKKLEKSKIAVFGGNKNSIRTAGGITINNTAIETENKIKILGCTLKDSHKSKTLVEDSYRKAMGNLIKIKRFRSAPIKVKKHLYKALIRPILEYPHLILHKTGITNMRKLQIVQNRALRYILNHKLKDKVKISAMHEKLKIEPINLRLNKLAKKMLYKAKDRYCSKHNTADDIFYRLSDYAIEDPPLKTKKRSISERINKYVYNKSGRKSVLHSLPDETKWKTPTALL